MPTQVQGLLLAAGAGRRMGLPKALVRDADGTSWLLRSVMALRDGGCPRVTVILGAQAAEAQALLDATGAAGVPGTSSRPDGFLSVAVAEDWAEGMGASLRAGLRALESDDHDDPDGAVLISLVDLPDVGPEVVARLVDAAAGRRTLARAAYDAVPGHPVLLGRDHWAGVIDAAAGDRGARDYLAAREVHLVECGDLATGRDQDTR